MVICSSILKTFGLAAKPFMKKSACSDYEIKTIFAKLHNLVNIMATKNNDFCRSFFAMWLLHWFMTLFLLIETIFSNLKMENLEQLGKVQLNC